MMRDFNRVVRWSPKLWPTMRSVMLPTMGLTLALSSAPAMGEDLFEALASAYVSNPTLQAARSSVRSSYEGLPQALAGWRPTVSLNGTAGVASSRSSLTSQQDRMPYSYSADLSQSLYAGGGTVAAIDEAESNVQLARAQLANVEQTVLLDGVTAFLDVLRDYARVQLTRNNELVLKRQLEATRDRFEVGEVTRTDVAQAEARLSGVVAVRVTAEGALAASRASYALVFGVMPGTLRPAPQLPVIPATESEALAIAEAENPQFAVVVHNEAAARHALRAAEADLLPTVDLAGQMQRTDEASLENVSAHSNSLIATVSIPLYQAGGVHSQIRAAKELVNQRRIEVEQSRRDIAEATSQAWERLTTTRSQISARSDEIRANNIALEGVRQEAEVGSRTTLDVLNAEQELLNSSVALVVAERDEYVAGYLLLSAIGRLTPKHIGLNVQIYDPDQHYQKARNKWWGWNVPKD